jgi:hypothetical protein
LDIKRFLVVNLITLITIAFWTGIIYLKVTTLWETEVKYPAEIRDYQIQQLSSQVRDLQNELRSIKPSR